MSAPHPSRDELLAMAFVDDQLDHEARAAFEIRLASEPELGREVTALRRLELMARSAAPPEPVDLAWRSIDAAPSQRATLGLGWLLTFAGIFGLLVIGLVELFAAHLPVWEQLSLGALFAGLALIFLAILRRRILSRPFDPYTAVKR